MMTFLRRHLRSSPTLWKAVNAVRTLAEPVVWLALDSGETLLGKRDPLTPPRRLMNVGTNQFTRSDFNSIGRELFRYLVDIGELKPDDKVLDVGCGVGRMAIPMTRYLTAGGSYDGFDIVGPSIEQCKRAFSPGFENFHFHHADLYNDTYNPGGRFLSHEYRFPFPDQTFSFVFLTSVFTHMLSPGVQNYLSEIRRVLAPGGRCFITYFLLNEDAEGLMEADKSAIQFRFPVDSGKAANPDKLEDVVAFDESFVREAYKKAGLCIAEPFRYGSWSGRQTDVGYQDIVVAVRKPDDMPGHIASQVR